jgi:hypothetical protein
VFLTWAASTRLDTLACWGLQAFLIFTGADAEKAHGADGTVDVFEHRIMGAYEMAIKYQTTWWKVVLVAAALRLVVDAVRLLFVMLWTWSKMVIVRSSAPGGKKDVGMSAVETMTLNTKQVMAGGVVAGVYNDYRRAGTQNARNQTRAAFN